jgi:hypothetical protein
VLEKNSVMKLFLDRIPICQPIQYNTIQYNTTTKLKIITMFQRFKENYSTWRKKRVENGV